MIDILKIAFCVALIAIIFYLQGCVTINVTIDQGKILNETPQYYEDTIPGDEFLPPEVLPAV